jgi:hypothetical protein
VLNHQPSTSEQNLKKKKKKEKIISQSGSLTPTFDILSPFLSAFWAQVSRKNNSSEE